STEEFRTTNNDLMGSRWIPRVPIGGRVRHINVSRAPSLEEIRQGTIHAREDHAVTQYAQLLLEWENERTGVRETIEFEIEVSLLSTPPDRWPAKVLNTLPAKLSMHPEWPPVGMDGVNWMKAIKRNSGEDWMSRRAWEATGWAPTQDSDPVYTVGEQV